MLIPILEELLYYTSFPYVPGETIPSCHSSLLSRPQPAGVLDLKLSGLLFSCAFSPCTFAFHLALHMAALPVTLARAAVKASFSTLLLQTVCSFTLFRMASHLGWASVPTAPTLRDKSWLSSKNPFFLPVNHSDLIPGHSSFRVVIWAGPGLQAYNPSTPEVKAGRSGLKGHLGCIANLKIQSRKTKQNKSLFVCIKD